MSVLAIDPGNEQSAFVAYDNEHGESRPLAFRKIDNAAMLRIVLDPIHELGSSGAFMRHLVIEMIASYGMPVGREVFETCLWIGRFIQAWGDRPYTLVYRRDVKLHLCGSPRAKDGNIRQALIDRYGGKEHAIGKKATPGPLYGVSADVWAALAVAVTFVDGGVRSQ